MVTYEKTRCLLCGREGFVKRYNDGDGIIAHTKDLSITHFPKDSEDEHDFVCKCGGGIYRVDCEKPTPEPEWE